MGRDVTALDVPILPGMREDLSPWTAPSGTLRSAINVRFFREGIAEQRWGSVAVGKGGEANALPITSGEGVGFIARRGNQGLMGTGGLAFAYDDVGAPPNGTDAWQFCGRYSSSLPVRKRRGLWSEYGFTDAPTCITTNSVVAVAAVDGLGRAQLVVERDDGTTLLKAEFAGTATRLVQVNGTIYWLVQSGTTVTGFTLRSTYDQIVAGPTAVVTLANATDHWDADVFSTTRWCLVYRSGAALSTVALMNVFASATTATFATTGAAEYSIFGDGTNVWVGYYDNPAAVGGGFIICYSNALAVVAGPTGVTGFPLVSTGGPPLLGPSLQGAGFVDWAFLDTSGAFEDKLHAGSYSTSGTLGSYNDSRGVAPWTRPDRGRIWGQAAVRAASTTIRSARTVLLRQRTIVAGDHRKMELACDLGLGALIARRGYTKARQKTDGNWVVPTFIVLRQGNPTVATFLVGVEIIEYSNSDVEASRDTSSTSESLVVAGQPVEVIGGRATFLYDGAVTSQIATGDNEIGFANCPSIASIVGTVGAGLLTALATYSYRSTWEWIDALGRRHLSTPTDPFSVALTGGQNTITVTSPPLDWHLKVDTNTLVTPGRPRQHLYRLVAADGLYHRVSPDSGAPDATVGPVTSVDLMSDAIAATQEVLYSEGGVLPNRLAPACRHVAESQQRLWCAGLLSARIVECSKLRVPSEPYEFTGHESHQVFLEDDCNGIACQDGLVFGFTKRGVYVWSGEGPNDQGQGSFSPPRLLTGDSGLGDYRSLLETAVGIIYQSMDTFKLVPRGGGVPQNIGDEVAITVQAFPTCIAACVAEQPGERTARFLLQASGGATRELVLDLDLIGHTDHAVWSSDARTGFTTLALGAWPQGPLFAQALSSTNPFLYERHDVAQLQLDNATRIDISVRFADLRPFGRVGTGHFRSLFAFVELWNPGTASGLVARLFKQDVQVELIVGSITQQYARFVPSTFNGETALGLSIEESVDTAEVKALCGLQLEIDPLEGPRRMTGATQQFG